MVTIEINGISKSAKPSGGVAVFEIEGLAAGVKTVVATYAGDDVYAFNSTTANFTVSKVKSSVNVTVSGRTVKVSVPEDATGYVIVNVNGTEYAINITAGDSEITIRLTKSGIYYVVATYLGDDKYLSSENSTSFAGKATDDTTNI